MSSVSRNRVNAESRSIHVAALATIAISQPLFDLLGKAPEFLLAHDLGPSQILLLVGVLGVVLPLVCAAIVTLLSRLHAGAGRIAAAALVSFFTLLVALYAIKGPPGGVWFIASVAAGISVVAGVSYYRSPIVRSFASWLAPAIVVVPLVFLLRPGVRSLIWPQQHGTLGASNSQTPVVWVVFDGLPLTALLDAQLRIDRQRYPSFAALADQSTWYRNATTVSDYTQWAVPAMLTARYPQQRALPIASDHPETLFTWLGSSHTVKAYEPITRLCPPSICEHSVEESDEKLINFGEALSVAYLHAILPEEVEDSLPPIDEGWADGIPPSEKPGEVWLRGGDRSRRGQAVEFISAIESNSEPSLYYLHVLLPHIPLAYLPEGHRYGTERTLPGLLDTRDRWVDDEWAATQGYRRFLLQVGYVDTLLGQLLTQLKQTGLYDRALIVVASDHGGSFEEGQRFRRLTDDNAADIVPIPLFIKAPQQTQGAISDRNVETIDILPTVADIMRVALPWRHDGVSAVEDRAAKIDKTVFHDDAKRVKKFPAALTDGMRASIDRKVRLFGDDKNLYLIPRTSPNYDLIGRAIDDLRVSDATEDLEFTLDIHGDFSHVDIDDRFLPAHLMGRARWRDSKNPAVVAIAINGIIRATTRTYRFEERGSHYTWSAVLPGDAFRRGENEVDVFVVRGSTHPVLYRTHFTHARPVDLLSNAAAYGMQVSHEGVHERKGQGEGSFRWTDGDATIVVPHQAVNNARALRVNLATTGAAPKNVRIRANGCDVFEGTVPPTRWSRIFRLPDCDNDDGASVLEIQSDTHEEAGTGRNLGVAVERIDLLTQAWPPPASALAESDRRSQIRFSNAAADDQIVGSRSEVSIAVVNRGTVIWGTPGDLGQDNGAVRLGVMWLRKGETTAPLAVQRVELPRSLVPGDTADMRFQLVPATSTGAPLPRGEYDVWIGMMQEGFAWFYPSGDSVRKLRVVHDPRP